VLLGALGPDSRTSSVASIAKALRDAGMEVVYAGPEQTPERLANASIQEDADVVGLWSLSAAHAPHVARLAELLREQGAKGKLVIASGAVASEEASALEGAGIAKVFALGAETDEIADYVRAWWESGK
jgi:methylmalonyl-CoA mutase C-terminal domain/subunit